MTPSVHRLSLLTVLASGAALLTATPLDAQLKVGPHLAPSDGPLVTGLALVANGDIGKRGFRPGPEHDWSPPRGLERMSIGEALERHLVGWIGGDAVGRVSGARVRGFILREGRVRQKCCQGRTLDLRGGKRYMEDEEEPLMAQGYTGFFSDDAFRIPLQAEFSRRGGLAQQPVRGYDVSTRPVPLGKVIEQPGRLLVNGIFDSPREMRMGNVLMLVLVPEDRKMLERAEGTVMLVMF